MAASVFAITSPQQGFNRETNGHSGRACQAQCTTPGAEHPKVMHSGQAGKWHPRSCRDMLRSVHMSGWLLGHSGGLLGQGWRATSRRPAHGRLPVEAFRMAAQHTRVAYLRHNVRLNVAVVVLACPHKPAAGLEALRHHVVNQAVLVPAAQTGGAVGLAVCIPKGQEQAGEGERACVGCGERSSLPVAARRVPGGRQAAAKRAALCVERGTHQMPRFSNCCWYLVR